MTIEYHDAYLAPLIDKTPEWETRAAEDVAQLGTFPTAWSDKLTVLRAYLLCRMESLADEQDVFSAKLTQYRKEWAATLQAARIAAGTPTAPGFPMTTPLERA